MKETSLKEKTAKGLLWGGIGNGAMQLINLAFGVFLARLLTSTDYGMVAVLTIFSAMAGIFSESGFILTLVNKKEVKHEDYNAVFWFNISIGASLYCILFISAPFIADFYDDPIDDDTIILFHHVRLDRITVKGSSFDQIGRSTRLNSSHLA